MARRQILNLFFQPVPANHPPAVWIRQVDHALLAGLATFAALALGLGWIVWRPLFGNPVPDGGLISQLFGYPALVLSQLTHGHFFRHAVVDNPAVFSLFALHVRLLPVWLLSLSAGTAVFLSALTPWRRMQHIEGPQLLDGKEAVEAAKRQAAKELGGQEPFMWLGPHLPLPKTRWTRGVILYGSPGSGKTVVLHQVIRQLIEAAHRAFFYDVKGDLTACYLGMNGTVGLVCPWDKRSLVWDIGRDVRSPSQAQVFAAALIPDAGGDGKFWSSAARQLLEGTLISLQNELGINWGWQTLADRLAVDSVVMAERMAKHSPMAELLVKDDKSSTTSSVLATLVGFTRMVQDLSRAWLDGEDEAGNFRPSISFTAWAKDGYPGKIRQIIFQAGDRAMTTALGSAILNVLTPELLSASTPDDEQRRTIAFVLDEMPSLGEIPFQGLIERGRSKGIVLVAACQTLEQIKEVWGEETMKGLGAMIGTHLVFRVQQSASRDTIAEQFGKARWSITGVTTSANGGSTNVHEENRAVVQPHELSELGPVKGKQFPLRWGIQAMVALGGDVLTLDFPGVSPPRRRTAHKPAKWTKGPAQPGMEPEMSPTLRLMLAKSKAANEELEREAQKRRNEEARVEARKRNEERHEANKRRHAKTSDVTSDGPDFPYESAKKPAQRDEAAWAAARTVPASPKVEDPFEPEVTASTARERILAGAKRASTALQTPTPPVIQSEARPPDGPTA